MRDEGNTGLGFGNTTLVHVGGYLGIVLSVIGFYAALETVVNETVQPYGCSRLEHLAVAPVP